MSWTIRTKLTTLGALGTLLTLLLGLVQRSSAHTATDITRALQISSEAIRNHVEGDMIHEGLRGDAYGALLASDPAALKAISQLVDEHSKHFRELLAANQALDLDARIRGALTEIAPKLESYIGATRQLVDKAATDPDAAKAMRPAFDDAFAAMETAQEKVSDLLVAHTKELDAAAASTLATASMLANVLLGLGVLVMVGGTVLIARSILRPLADLGARVDDMASGQSDLTHRLDDTHRDELGRVAHGVNAVMGKLQRMLQDLGGKANSVQSSSQSLLGTADQLAKGSELTQKQSAQVAAAAEEMHASLQEASRVGQETSQRIQNVARAVEQIGASTADVANGAQETKSIADQAARLANDSNTLIKELGQAAGEIGRVIETIQDIADQTNLLALNATIEAARAGEAGRGFAVVASEVKQLATQTSTATLDIRQRVERIQTDTTRTVQSMGAIVQVIDKVNAASRQIAQRADDQRAAMGTITADVVAAAKMMAEASNGIQQSAEVSAEIAHNIHDVDTTARQSSAGAASTNAAGQELARLADGLQQTLGQFRI